MAFCSRRSEDNIRKFIAAALAAALAMTLFSCAAAKPAESAGRTGAEPVSAAETNESDALETLYLNVIDDLYNSDKVLNNDMDVIGLDLSGALNLSDDQKAAVSDAVAEKYGMTVVNGTWDELADKGYIDRDKLLFADGALISVTADEKSVKDDSFTFDAEKWRSGTGAIFYTGCRAARGSDGSWSWEPGGFAIS